LTVEFAAGIVEDSPPRVRALVGWLFIPTDALDGVRMGVERAPPVKAMLLINVGRFSMTLSEERCPTCDGSGFVARNNQRAPGPTCSHASNTTTPYPTPDAPYDGGALRFVRSTAYLVGAAALVAALALLIKVLWH